MSNELKIQMRQTTACRRFVNYRAPARFKGSAIIETTVGIFVLLPIFFLLIDVIALVIAQSVNDDLAKQAARYAAQQTSNYNPDGSTKSQQQMQLDAQGFANNYIQQYIQSRPSIAADTGIITEPVITGVNFDPNAGQVQVNTQITCNLPVRIPGIPGSMNFQAQYTTATVAVQPNPIIAN